jgi:hypothetical protein
MAKVRLCGVYKTEDFDSLLFRQGSASSGQLSGDNLGSSQAA